MSEEFKLPTYGDYLNKCIGVINMHNSKDGIDVVQEDYCLELSGFSEVFYFERKKKRISIYKTSDVSQSYVHVHETKKRKKAAAICKLLRELVDIAKERDIVVGVSRYYLNRGDELAFKHLKRLLEDYKNMEWNWKND